MGPQYLYELFSVIDELAAEVLNQKRRQPQQIDPKVLFKPREEAKKARRNRWLGSRFALERQKRTMGRYVCYYLSSALGSKACFIS